jgi:hypothetical protein
MTMTDLPIVCTLTPETLATRRAELLPGLVRQAELVEDLSDGFRLRFAPDEETLNAIARTIAAERLCCRFLRFEMIVEPDGGPLFLSVRGPEGAREFLAALIF